MRDSEYRDKYQRRISRMRAKYRQRAFLVFFLALVLGFLLGWIIYGQVMDGRSDDKSVAATQSPDPSISGSPEATWFDGDESTAEPTAESTAEPKTEPTETSAVSDFMDDSTEQSTETPTSEPNADSMAVMDATGMAEATAEPQDANATAEATQAVTAEKGTKENPVLIGEPYSFVTQLHADGTPKTNPEDTEEAYDLPVTLTLSRYLTPDYYAENYSTQYQIKGDEAGTELDIELGECEGLSVVSMQSAIVVMFENDMGDMAMGYKFTDAEIDGESNSDLAVEASGTIYKRFKFDPAANLSYMTLTYYNNAQPSTIYFSLTESVLPEETPTPTSTEPETTASAGATTSTDDGSYTIGDSGDGVKKLQQKLVDLGYLSGTPDGKFGKWTGDAVKAAQEALGLEQTGVADAEFLDLLYKK